MVLDVRHVNFGYTQERVLKDINLEVNKGEVVVIIGGNGSGKSTLMKLIIGELSPDAGEITLLNQDSKSRSDYGRIGYVPQSNVVSKIPFPVTCLELVVLELQNEFGLIKIPRKRHKEVARQMLIDMGLEEHINKPFNELSGGLQQRVMIARAMIHDPELLILDEPTAGVDEASKLHFAGIIQELNEKNGITIILITHELDWVKEYVRTDQILELKNGGLEPC